VQMPPQATGQITQLPAWAPTSDGEIDEWAMEQADAWARPQMRSAIDDAKGRITAELSQGDPSYRAPSGATMSDDEVAAWVMEDITANGFPNSPDAASALTMRFLDAQGSKMGFHPGFVGQGAELVMRGWPTNIDDAAAWGGYVGNAVMQQYGLSLPSDWDVKGVTTAAASAACLQAGVPFVGVVTTSIDSMWDGKLTFDEIEDIVVAVGSAVGAAVGQMFGIPAPIGAFVGAIVTALIFDGLASAFGWGPSAAEMRGRAWNKMLEARAAMMEQCMEIGVGAWGQYNDYWNEMIAGFDTSLNEYSDAMGAGIRAFGTKRLNYLVDNDGNEQVLFRPIYDRCDAAAGCLYYGTYGAQAFGYERDPAAASHRIHERPNPLDIKPVPAWQGAKEPSGRIDPYSALAYYGASRYATPFQADLERLGFDNRYVQTAGQLCWSGGRMSGAYTECWEQQLHSDYEYLENLAYIRTALKAEDLEQCSVPGWAAYMMASLVQVGPASAFVMNDVSATVSANTAEQEVIARMQVQLDDYNAVRQVTVQAAQERRDILRMRRARASREARLHYGALAAGTGSLAGYLISKMLGGKLR